MLLINEIEPLGCKGGSDMQRVVAGLNYRSMEALKKRTMGFLAEVVWAVLSGHTWSALGLTCSHRETGSLKQNTSPVGLTVSPAGAAEPPSFGLCASTCRPFEVRQNGSHSERTIP